MSVLLVERQVWPAVWTFISRLASLLVDWSNHLLTSDLVSWLDQVLLPPHISYGKLGGTWKISQVSLETESSKTCLIDTVSTYALYGNFYTSSLSSKVQIQAQIDDSHVVKILDTVSVTETSQLFIVMELCEGGNLFQWIQRNRKHKMLNETVSSASGVLMTVRDVWSKWSNMIAMHRFFYK